MRFQVPFSSAKNYFLGFATSALFLVSGMYYYKGSPEPQKLPPVFSESSLTKPVTDQPFNPNNLSSDEWKDLGFSERQVQTILKYKNVLGGNFRTKEELKKCYVISDEKFQELEPFISLPPGSASAGGAPRFANYNTSARQYYNYPASNRIKHNLTVKGKFNPDHYSTQDFMRLGFTEKQAISILKYKNYLGGSFISKEKFKECYIISEENYRKLAPYLILPEKMPEHFKKSYNTAEFRQEKKEKSYEPFDPNITDLEGWKSLGFSERQAQVILNYRDRNLKGSFKNLEDIARCFVISPEKFEALKPFIVLNSENFSQKNIPYLPSAGSGENMTKTLANPTDFSKTDLNEITFKQLIEFGFDERSAASFIGFRNKLGGFVTKNQIMETYNIDKELAQKLVDTAPLRTENVPKYSLNDAPEEWLKNHPYFKYYADKIIYYRISYTDENKFFRTMKIKPEAEKRMKLYLK